MVYKVLQGHTKLQLPGGVACLKLCDVRNLNLTHTVLREISKKKLKNVSV